MNTGHYTKVSGFYIIPTKIFCDLFYFDSKLMLLPGHFNYLPLLVYTGKQSPQFFYATGKGTGFKR